MKFSMITLTCFALAGFGHEAENVIRTLESLKPVTRLPSAGGDKSVVADHHGDGFKDLIFAQFIHGS
ncbi:MAG TPA: hypothetical protein VGD22_02940 [Sphingobacteriaceae bacterium]